MTHRNIINYLILFGTLLVGVLAIHARITDGVAPAMLVIPTIFGMLVSVTVIVELRQSYRTNRNKRQQGYTGKLHQ